MLPPPNDPSHKAPPAPDGNGPEKKPAPPGSPQQQPKKRGCFGRSVRLVILIGLLVVVATFGWSTHTFMATTTAGAPWQWSGDQWGKWWDHTISFGKEAAHKTKEAGQKAIDKVKSFDWGKLLSPKTEELAKRTDEVTKKLEAQKAAKKDAAYAQKFAGPGGQDYEYGVQWLEKGLAEWKVSIKEVKDQQAKNQVVLNPAATERAQKYFEKAVTSFETARKANPSLPDLDNLLMQAQDFQSDSKDRLKQIQEIQAQQPPK